MPSQIRSPSSKNRRMALAPRSTWVTSIRCPESLRESTGSVHARSKFTTGSLANRQAAQPVEPPKTTQMAASGRERQGRSAPNHSIGVRAVGQEPIHRSQLASPGCRHERGLFVPKKTIQAKASPPKIAERPDVASGHRLKERWRQGQRVDKSQSARFAVARCLRPGQPLAKQVKLTGINKPDERVFRQGRVSFGGEHRTGVRES